MLLGYASIKKAMNFDLEIDALRTDKTVAQTNANLIVFTKENVSIVTASG